MTQADIKMSTPSHPIWLRGFSIIAIIEAVTWTGLLAGMYFKYVPETTELGVRIFGSLHGAAFVCYILITIIVVRQQRWPIRWTSMIALGASIPPLGTIAFELWARKHDLLNATADGNRAHESTDNSGNNQTPPVRTR